MKHGVLAFALLAASVMGGFPTPSHAQAGVVVGAAAGMTVGGLMNALKDVVKQLEQSAHSLIDHGNNALAQQQLLLSGILQGLIDQASVAYADSLDKTFGQLGAEEQSAFTNVFQALAQAKDLVQSGGKELQGAIYKTQGAANQLLTRLPLTTHFPVFYGVQVRDILTNPDESPSDVEILGFMLTDPRLNGKRPIVNIGGKNLDAKFVSVQEDRIQVQLPDEIKNALDFGQGPCKPRRTFPIAFKVFYGQSNGIWPVRWTTEKDIGFNANAVPGNIYYEYKITYDGVRTSKTLVAQNFSVQSGVVSAGCTETTSTSVAFNAPAGSLELNCTAAWVSPSNVKASSQNCAPGGTVATASGSITGRDRSCFVRDVVSWVGGGFLGALVSQVVGHETLCDCPGGANARLEASGTYKVPTTTTDPISGASVGTPILAKEGVAASVGLPVDTGVEKKVVRVEITRRGCSQIVDTITLNLGATPNLIVNQTSSKGQFVATLRNDQLSISPVK